MTCYSPAEGRPGFKVVKGSLPVIPGSSQLPSIETDITPGDGESESHTLEFRSSSHASTEPVDHDLINRPSEAPHLLSISLCSNQPSADRCWSAPHPNDVKVSSSVVSPSPILIDRASIGIGNTRPTRAMIPPIPVSRGINLGSKLAFSFEREWSQMLDPWLGASSSGASSSSTVLYGFDVGEPDYDTSETYDNSMIVNFRPPEKDYVIEYAGLVEKGRISDLDAEPSKPRRHTLHHKSRSIRIPTSLLPLPDILLSSPANLLYFHHFMTSTAKTFVAHDCLQNPFKIIILLSE